MNDYYSETKAPCKPCKIQVCDRDQFGPVLVKETAQIWDDSSYAFCLAIEEDQARFVPGRFVQTVNLKGEVI